MKTRIAASGLVIGAAFAALLAGGCARAAPPAKAAAVRLRLSTTPSPAPVGRPVQFVLKVVEPDGQPVTGAQAELALTMASMDMGTIEVRMREQSPGRYMGQGTISMGGDWNCRAIVQWRQHRIQQVFRVHAG